MKISWQSYNVYKHQKTKGNPLVAFDQLYTNADLDFYVHINLCQRRSRALKSSTTKTRRASPSPDNSLHPSKDGSRAAQAAKTMACHIEQNKSLTHPTIGALCLTYKTPPSPKKKNLPPTSKSSHSSRLGCLRLPEEWAFPRVRTGVGFHVTVPKKKESVGPVARNNRLVRTTDGNVALFFRLWPFTNLHYWKWILKALRLFMEETRKGEKSKGLSDTECLTPLYRTCAWPPLSPLHLLKGARACTLDLSPPAQVRKAGGNSTPIS
jgi:hypothetical protein